MVVGVWLEDSEEHICGKGRHIWVRGSHICVRRKHVFRKMQMEIAHRGARNSTTWILGIKLRTMLAKISIIWCHAGKLAEITKHLYPVEHLEFLGFFENPNPGTF